MKIRSKTFAGLYETVLSEVYTAYDHIVKPRGMEIKELDDVVLELTNPYSNLFKNPVRSIPLKYLCGELYWYFTGLNDTEFISRYAKFWKEISSKDGFKREIANSAYGWMLFERNKPYITEWTWAFESLVRDPDSRQAILHFNTPKYLEWGIKDFPCTMDGVFKIRESKLNFTVHMRSQDVMKGLTYDLPFFSLLQQNMLINLLEEEKFRDKFNHLMLGSLTLFINSEHLYATDYMKARQMLLSTFCEDRLPQMKMPLYKTENCHEKYTLVNGSDGDPLCAFIYQHAELTTQQPETYEFVRESR